MNAGLHEDVALRWRGQRFLLGPVASDWAAMMAAMCGVNFRPHGYEMMMMMVVVVVTTMMMMMSDDDDENDEVEDDEEERIFCVFFDKDLRRGGWPP